MIITSGALFLAFRLYDDYSTVNRVCMSNIPIGFRDRSGLSKIQGSQWASWPLSVVGVGFQPEPAHQFFPVYYPSADGARFEGRPGGDPRLNPVLRALA